MKMNNMVLRDTIKSKSDQLNVDDLLGGDRMIQVEGVNIVNDPQQPIHIYYVGCNNIPYKPCLTVRRILIALWGEDEYGQASHWVGRWMNLYVDPTVSYGKQKNCGGIRVNAVSNIPNVATVKATVKRGIKQEFKIQPITLS